MKRLIGGCLLAIGLHGAAQAQASEPFLGQIMIFAGNFCPRGWAPTDGAVLSIAENIALFSVLGTMYGGDGRSTFALPKTQTLFTQTRAPLIECIAVEGVFPSRN